MTPTCVVAVSRSSTPPVMSVSALVMAPAFTSSERTMEVISSVERVVAMASSLTSSATTPNPLPASPAWAASMVAFSASRCVCAATFEMARAIPSTWRRLTSSCSTVSPARRPRSTTCRVSSSVAPTRSSMTSAAARSSPALPATISSSFMAAEMLLLIILWARSRACCSLSRRSAYVAWSCSSRAASAWSSSARWAAIVSSMVSITRPSAPSSPP